MTAAEREREVVHDGYQCKCPNKVICEDAEEAQAKARRASVVKQEAFEATSRQSGAAAERLRIRRAQREALRELGGYVEAVAQKGSYLYRVVRDLDKATRAPRPVGRKRTK